ncbi:MAG: hypothetical protein WC759_04480 [Candidatus Micrarchaeia archaeon]|jgi:hypothetical protein
MGEGMERLKKLFRESRLLRILIAAYLVLLVIAILVYSKKLA